MEIVIVVDTSGSITADNLSEMVAIVNDIKMQMPVKLRVFYCDCAIQKEETFDIYETLEFHPVGGGGTDFKPVFNKLSEEGEEPSVLIYMTDGECDSYPDRNTLSFPVIWVYFRDEVELEYW